MCSDETQVCNVSSVVCMVATMVGIHADLFCLFPFVCIFTPYLLWDLTRGYLDQIFRPRSLSVMGSLSLRYVIQW